MILDLYRAFSPEQSTRPVMQSRTHLKTNNVSKLPSSIQLASLCHKASGSLGRGWTGNFPWLVCSYGFKVLNALWFQIQKDFGPADKT